jgi:hypothetical protein
MLTEIEQFPKVIETQGNDPNSCCVASNVSKIDGVFLDIVQQRSTLPEILL